MENILNKFNEEFQCKLTKYKFTKCLRAKISFQFP